MMRNVVEGVHIFSGWAGKLGDSSPEYVPRPEAEDSDAESNAAMFEEEPEPQATPEPRRFDVSDDHDFAQEDLHEDSPQNAQVIQPSAADVFMKLTDAIESCEAYCTTAGAWLEGNPKVPGHESHINITKTRIRFWELVMSILFHVYVILSLPPDLQC